MRRQPSLAPTAALWLLLLSFAPIFRPLMAAADHIMTTADHVMAAANQALAAGVVEAERGTVVKVFDGDTLVVDLNGRREKVRLIGVDAPEVGRDGRPAQPHAFEAARFVRRMAQGRRVVLRAESGRPDRDRYGRLLRYVDLEDGACLNAEILKRGYGRALLHFPFSRAREFKSYERQARLAHVGIWSDAS